MTSPKSPSEVDPGSMLTDFVVKWKHDQEELSTKKAELEKMKNANVMLEKQMENFIDLKLQMQAKNEEINGLQDQVKAIGNEIKEENNALKSENKQLQMSNSELKSKINDLEARATTSEKDVQAVKLRNCALEGQLVKLQMDLDKAAALTKTKTQQEVETAEKRITIKLQTDFEQKNADYVSKIGRVLKAYETLEEDFNKAKNESELQVLKAQDAERVAKRELAEKDLELKAMEKNWEAEFARLRKEVSKSNGIGIHNSQLGNAVEHEKRIGSIVGRLESSIESFLQQEKRVKLKCQSLESKAREIEKNKAMLRVVEEELNKRETRLKKEEAELAEREAVVEMLQEQMKNFEQDMTIMRQELDRQKSMKAEIAQERQHFEEEKAKLSQEDQRIQQETQRLRNEKLVLKADKNQMDQEFANLEKQLAVKQELIDIGKSQIIMDKNRFYDNYCKHVKILQDMQAQIIGKENQMKSQMKEYANCVRQGYAEFFAKDSVYEDLTTKFYNNDKK